MGKPWSAQFKTVIVPTTSIAKHVTIVMPFYEAHAFLRDQIAHWWTYDQALRWHLSAIIVDDGSPRPLDLSGVKMPFSVRVFRIDVDVPWNWLAARNIGAHHASDGWLFLTDMDHMLPDSTAYGLVCGDHDPSVVYAFSRREHTGEAINPHSASFFMTRQTFWRIGGYDERLSGVYGTDGSYRKRVSEQAWIRILKDELVRYEYVADSSVRQYERKTPKMRAERERRFNAVRMSGTPKVLSFPYHEVTL